LPARGTRLAVSVAYENTLVATDDLVRLYQNDGFATFDGKVTQQVLRGVAAGTPGRTAYFLDGEVMRAEIEFGLGLGKRFELDVEAPFLLHTAGAFDTVIDSYHDRFGLPDGGRSSFAQDRYVMGLETPGGSVFVDQAPGSLRPGDLVLTGRLALLAARGRRPGITASLAAKLPTGSAGRLDGSGSTDYGASLLASGRFGRSSWNGGYAIVHPGDWSLAPRLSLQQARSAFGAYAFSISARSALVVQVLRTSGPFHYRPGSDLGRTAMEAAFGARHRLIGGRILEWAVIENLDRYQNTPDIGVFLGLTLREAGGESGSRPWPPADNPLQRHRLPGGLE